MALHISKSGLKNRKGRMFVLVIGALLTVGLIAYYQVQVHQSQLEQDIQGLSEYQLCMYAYEKFDIEMVKKMGCVNEKYQAIGKLK